MSSPSLDDDKGAVPATAPFNLDPTMNDYDFFAAQDPSTPSDYLAYLARYTSDLTRFYVLRNPNTPQGIWIRLLRMFP